MSKSRAFWGTFALMFGVAATLLSSCQSGNKESNLKGDIYVSAAPIKVIVERITGDDFPVQVIVPEGEDIKNYKATSAQSSAVKTAQLFVATGLLGFEASLSKNAAKRGSVVEISDKITKTNSDDPYIWMSPSNLQIIAKSVYEVISTNHPDSVKYRRNYIRLQQELERLETQCKAMIAANKLQNIFIYQPSLTYYAAAYDLDQIVLSTSGEESLSEARIGEVIALAEANHAKILLYQSADPVSQISGIANKVGAEYIEINPMEANSIKNVWDITRLLTSR